MHSSIALSLLAAVYVVARPQDLPTDTDTALIATDTAALADFTACIPPTDLTVSLSPAPTLPPDFGSYFYSMTITDACAYETAVSSLPKSLSSEFSSYVSAASSWEKANGPAITSQASAYSSWEASIMSIPACSSLLGDALSSLSVASLTTGFGSCSTGSDAKSTSGATKTGTASGAASTASGASSASASGAASSGNGAFGTFSVPTFALGGLTAGYLAFVAML